jgi:hypothetical protein
MEAIAPKSDVERLLGNVIQFFQDMPPIPLRIIDSFSPSLVLFWWVHAPLSKLLEGPVTLLRGRMLSH